MKRGLTYSFKDSASIPLILNSYEDMFSDFDPRPYSGRALSGDFLMECKRASADKKCRIDLRLFIPKSKRDPTKEIKIKKRLKEHFLKHLRERKREIRKIHIQSIFWIALGAVMMVLGAILLQQPTSFLTHLLTTLVQPAGWFFLWEGMAKLFIFIPTEKKPEYQFYKKMADSKISFLDDKR